MNTTTDMLLFILVCSIAIAITRLLPFLIFRDQNKIPKSIEYLGKTLPYAITGFLVVYCLKDVNFTSGTYGLPEIISIVFIICIHLWRKNTLLSVVSGTLIYMALVNFIFI